jgi:dephospho-CoA kinase
VERLIRKRGLTHDEAMQRILSQSAQKDKVSSANVVIRNTGSYEDLWKQVTAQWKKVSPSGDTIPVVQQAIIGNLAVQRGRPRDSKSIAALVTGLSKGQQKMSPDDVMAGFGDKAYMLLKVGERLVGIAGWQVENLVARTTDVYMEDGLDPRLGLEALINEVERAAHDLQCEASLIFPPEKLAAQTAVWTKLGYERRTPEALGVQAWQDAANESLPTGGSALFFKQLRQDRVLRPI